MFKTPLTDFSVKVNGTAAKHNGRAAAAAKKDDEDRMVKMFDRNCS